MLLRFMRRPPRNACTKHPSAGHPEPVELLYGGGLRCHTKARGNAPQGSPFGLAVLRTQSYFSYRYRHNEAVKRSRSLNARALAPLPRSARVRLRSVLFYVRYSKIISPNSAQDDPLTEAGRLLVFRRGRPFCKTITYAVCRIWGRAALRQPR